MFRNKSSVCAVAFPNVFPQQLSRGFYRSAFVPMIVALGMALSSCGVGAKGDKLPFSSSTNNNVADAKVKEAWNQANDPFRLGSDYDYSFRTDLNSAHLNSTPWSDTYWPSIYAGVARRWFSSEEGAGDTAFHFDYKLEKIQKLKSLSERKLSELSPAEKFDIVSGRVYDGANWKNSYPLVKSEWSRTRGVTESWEGLCHGWAPAASLFQEPGPVKVYSPLIGKEIPFGAADVKALLSYYMATVQNGGFRMLGSRCNVDFSKYPDAANDIACRDTNAGAFHVVLVNRIGLRKEPLVADITRDFEVWNQPIYGYNFEVIGVKEGASPGAAAGTVKEAEILAEMQYVSELDPSWNKMGEEGQLVLTEQYKYRLELNAENKIIGGEWLSENRPDFLWTQELYDFQGEWAILGDIYRASIANR